MNKVELIASIAEKGKLSKKYAEDALEAFVATVNEALANGETVKIIGFGTFSMKDKAERLGRNPKTGETIKIPASRSVKFVGAKNK